MALQSIRYTPGQLEILDQLLLPVQSKYVNVKGVEDGWHVINKMQVSTFTCCSCISQSLLFYYILISYKNQPPVVDLKRSLLLMTGN